MAAALDSMKSVLRAHQITVNGCRALEPSLDEASLYLRQAHAILVVAREAAEVGVLNDEIIQAAGRAAETLLEVGIRNLEEGHFQMQGELRRALN